MSDRHWKRELKAIVYRDVALKGGGQRERARRVRQILEGKLTFDNGVRWGDFYWPHVETDKEAWARGGE